MLRIASAFVLVCFLTAPLAAAAATPLQLGLSDARPAGPAEQGSQLYAQNSGRPQAPVGTRKNSAMPIPQGPPQVYFLRGLMNVFSLGMDDLAGKLQGYGISSTVMNHADSDYVASRIMTTYNSGDRGPIVLIGHSLGADAVADIANTLARYNIPVSVLVLFDGTEPHQIPPTVTTAVNYTRHFMISAYPGSRGLVQNVDLSNDPAIDHLNIDAAPSLQQQTINYILQAVAAAGQPVRRQ
jgi:pimeloyl-ACP methyl ester carboxylesterase